MSAGMGCDLCICTCEPVQRCLCGTEYRWTTGVKAGDGVTTEVSDMFIALALLIFPVL